MKRSIVRNEKLRNVTVHSRGRQALLSAIEALEPRQLLTTAIVVNSNADNANDDSIGGTTVTLREAINYANDNPGRATISFDPTAFATAQTITLALGNLEINDAGPVIVQGPAAGVTLAGNGSGEVLLVDYGTTAELTGLTFTGGMNTGGIYNSGTLTLSNSTISGNSGLAGQGGGIYNGGTLNLLDSTVSGNSTSTQGGGIFNEATLSIVDSTISGNSAGLAGGGVYNTGTATIQNATISGNSADLFGGGIDDVTGGLSLENSIVAGNSAASGSEVCGASTTSAGYNLLGDSSEATADALSGFTTAAGDIVATSDGATPTALDAILDTTLADNGGPTQTLALVAASPAIDAGVTIAGITTDQRGALILATPDIGAYQYDYKLIVTSTADGANDDNIYGLTITLHEAVSFADAYGGDATISFDPTVFATPQTITLTQGLEINGTGSVIIQGAPAGVTVSGNGAVGDVYVAAGGSVVLENLTFTGGIGSNDQGGGIRNLGSLALLYSTVAENSANEGGGVYSSGSLLVVDSTLSGNAGQQGGGLFNEGTAVVYDDTFSGNSATLSGGGIYDSSGGVTLESTIVAGNSAPTGTEVDEILSVTSAGNNLLGDSSETTASALTGFTTAASDIVATSDGTTPTALDDILDTTLANNGGPTQTLALVPFSPAIEAGVAGPGIISDQRGVPRPVSPDIGAYQYDYALVVNTTDDDVNDDTINGATVTLREAINFTNAFPGEGVIYFDPTVFATAQTITLTLGYLDLSSAGPVIIEGSTAGITINGNGADSDLVVENGANAVIDGLTFTGGMATTVGGGIFNAGTLVLNNSTITGNSATLGGGGICNEGTLGLYDSTISGNSAHDGGGIITQGELVVSDSTISGNSAVRGGGILGYLDIFVSDSTISGNTASVGGGIINAGSLSLDNSTISGNSAVGGIGGGILNSGRGAIEATTISGNSADLGGGGIYYYSNALSTSLSLQNSIVAGNSGGGAGDEIFGNVTSLGHNLLGDSSDSSDSAFNGFTTVAGDITATSDGTTPTALDAILSTTLANNGGPTQTLALVATSPAIDAGVHVHGITTDQRGVPRPHTPDIGAYQYDYSLVVNTTADNYNDDYIYDATVTLREAINFANAYTGAATITFDPAVFATPQTITLEQGQLEVFDTGLVTVNGPSAGVTVDGGDGSGDGDLFVDTAANAGFDGVNFTDGTNGHGAGVYNEGKLTLSDSTISGNRAVFSTGGGIYNSGTLTVSDSIISGNRASGGGGIANSGTATVTDSTISGNYAGGGGGIDNSGTLTLTNSTISGNSAGSGGGIFNTATLTVTDSTISGNSATKGGGICNYFGLTMSDSTISGNSAAGGSGGGIYDSGYGTIDNTTISGNSTDQNGGGIYYAPAGIGAITLENSIVAGNSGSSGSEIYGPVTSGGYNLFGDSSETSALALSGFSTASTDIVATSDGATPTALNGILDTTLANNGGPTQTLAIVAGGPAINAGSNALIATGVTTDQRGAGYPRISGSIVDIGAYEFQFATPTISDLAIPTTATVGTSIADQATVSGGNNPTGTVTFNLYNSGGPGGAGAPLFSETNVPLVGGVATSSGYVPLATGTNYWVATYNGDNSNTSASTAAFSTPVVISKAATRFVSALGTTINYGTATAQVTGKVSATGVTPTGSVSITINGATVSTPLLSDGSFSYAFPTATMSAGSYQIVFNYAGNSNFSGSTLTTSTKALVINKRSTGFVSATGSTITYGASTVAVSGKMSAGGITVPDGSVAITINNEIALATVKSDGSFSFAFPTTGLNVGMYPITFNYLGDNNFLASTLMTSNAAIVILKRATAFSSATSTTINYATATVSLSGAIGASGVIPSDGTVSITVNGNTINVPLQSNGTFSTPFPSASIPAGTYTIGYAYSGDGNLIGSTISRTLVVNKRSTGFLNAVGSTITYGASSVPISGKVSGGGGVTVPDGTVAITVNSTTVNASVQPDGSFSYAFPTTGLSAGSYQITFTYSGDSNFLGNTLITSNAAIVINKRPAGFASASSATITHGTATASLTGKVSASGLIPTGTVSITINNVAVIVSLQPDGSFSDAYATSTLAPGSYVITYTYSGDANFLSATIAKTLIVK